MKANAVRAACVLALWLGASAVSAQTTSVDEPTSTTTTTTTSESPSTGTSAGTSVGTSTSTSTSTSVGTSTSTSPSTSTSSTHLATTTATTPRTPNPPPGAGTAPQPAPPPEHEEGDGRDVDFIWLEAFGGISNVNLVAFGNSNFAAAASSGGSSVFNEVNATGPMIGGALGFRVYWLAVGARTTFASYNTFQIGTVGGEVALRFPIPVVEPYIRAGFGYAWQGDANYTITTGGVTAQPATTVYGWAFNAAVGLDIFLTNWFTIGAGVGFDVLNMTRQSDPRMACMGATDFCPSRPGDAVGYQLSGYGQIGFHI